MRHRSLKPQASSSGSGSGILILIVIAVAAAIYFFVIKPSMEAPAPPAGAPAVQNAAPKPTTPAAPPKPARRKTVAQEGVKPIDDVDAFFVRVEGIMKDRFKEDIENYRQGLTTHAQSFETEAKQAINTAGASAGTSALADLSSAMQAWKNRNYLMADSLPPSLSRIAGIQESFSKSYAAQMKIQSRLNQRLRSEQASYIRGLNKQIERYRESKDFVAVSLLEKEITRLNSEPNYYGFLMGL
jgi:hypothetical protein